ncbi:MAG: hypothetical protein Greene07147_774 [Parcubacteria group bacterium Greene0714_7]|nr:MAG: hypothetical protein Greene07147_774 [Parcubacteria group bacterium Greene0714_7]
MKYTRSTLLVLFFLIVALITVVFSVPFSFSHSVGYWEIYLRITSFLIEGGTFGPDLYIAPGFPLLLASFAFFTDLNIISARVIQLALFLILIGGVYLIGRDIFRSEHTGRIAALLMLLPAVTLQLFALDSMLFYTTLITWSILCIWYASLRTSGVYPLVAGTALGFAALTDPIGVYVIPIILIWFIFLIRRRLFTVRSMVALLIFITSILTLMVPWYVRNIAVHEGLEVSAPFVQKRVETSVLFDSDTRSLLIRPFIQTPSLVFETALSMLFSPPDVDALAQYTPVSYRQAVLSFVRTKILSDEVDVATLFLKASIFFAHGVVVLFAVVGVWLMRHHFLSALFFTLLAYILFAVIGYGAPSQFKDISPIQEFVYPLYPFIYLYAAHAVFKIVTALSEKKRKHIA